MNKRDRERRLAENEVVFRQYNERVQEGFETIRKIAEEDDQEHLVIEHDEPILFYCECSDENCRERLPMTPGRYKEIHKKRNRFVVQLNHQTEDIECVVEEFEGYTIVEKFKTPPERARVLHTTDVNNS